MLSAGWRIVSGSLALVTPFVSLLRYEGYPLAQPESLGFAALLGLMGAPLGWGLGSASRGHRAIAGGLLAALFVEFQFYGAIDSVQIFFEVALLGGFLAWLLHENIGLILCTILATFFVSTLLIPGETAQVVETRGEVAGTPQAELPIVLHVVLDEWVGIDGVPLEIEGGESLRRDLEDFFTDRGFRVYPQAVSSYHNTKTSLSQLVNFKGEYVPGLAERGEHGFEWAVLENAYFDAMAERGYRTGVVQSSYLDFCASGEEYVSSCRTYPSWGLGFVAEQDWSVVTKMVMFARLYPLYSKAYSKLRKEYSKLRARTDGALPSWSWELFRPPSVSSLREMERLVDVVANLRRGDFVFAHFLLPHSPFALDADCGLREPSQWLDHKSRSLPAGRVNTPASRDARFRAHFDQVRCSLKLLDDIVSSLDRNPEANDAVVIIHGDHGARIAMYDPRFKHRERLTVEDHVGVFSTVFAARAPRLEPGAGSGVLSIQDLFASAFASGFTRSPELGLEGMEARVYFTKSGKRVVTSGPMPHFGRDASR